MKKPRAKGRLKRWCPAVKPRSFCTWKWKALRTTPLSTEYVKECVACHRVKDKCTGMPWSRCKCGYHEATAAPTALDPKAELKRLAGIREEP